MAANHIAAIARNSSSDSATNVLKSHRSGFVTAVNSIVDWLEATLPAIAGAGWGKGTCRIGRGRLRRRGSRCGRRLPSWRASRFGCSRRREIDVCDAVGWGGLGGAEAVDAGERGEGGAFFDDDRTADEVGVVRGGESFADLAGEKIEAFVFVALDPIAGGADDAVDGAAVAVGFAEEPLQWAADQGGVRRGEHRAVEPEMCAENGDALQLVEAVEAIVESWRRVRGNPFFEDGIIDGQDDGVGSEEFIAEFDADGADAFEADGGDAATEANVAAGERFIELAERAGGGSHAVGGFVKEHSFLENLNGVGGAGIAAVFVEGADKNQIVEFVDQAFGWLCSASHWPKEISASFARPAAPRRSIASIARERAMRSPRLSAPKDAPARPRCNGAGRPLMAHRRCSRPRGSKKWMVFSQWMRSRTPMRR